MKVSLFLENNEIANEIYESGVFDEKTELMSQALMEALLLGKDDLVRLWNDFHFEFSTFLTSAKLHQLYTSSNFSKRILQIVNHFIPNEQYNFERVENYENWNQNNFLKSLSNLERKITFDDSVTHREDRSSLDILEEYDSSPFVIEPIKELLIWSVLINKPELIEIFLEQRSSYGLHDRLAIATMYNKLATAQFSHHTSDMTESESFKQTGYKYINEAVGIIGESNKADPDKTSVLLRASCSQWNELSGQ